jgi:hypothetical protein
VISDIITQFAWKKCGKPRKALRQDSWSENRDLNLGHPNMKQDCYLPESKSRSMNENKEVADCVIHATKIYIGRKEKVHYR